MCDQGSTLWSHNDQGFGSRVIHRRSVNDESVQSEESGNAAVITPSTLPILGDLSVPDALREVSIEMSYIGESQQRLVQEPQVFGCIAPCFLQHRVDPNCRRTPIEDDQLQMILVSRPERLRAANDIAKNAKDLPPAPRYFHTHLECLYFTCMIPYKREPISLIPGVTPYWKQVAYYLQKVILWF